MMRGKVGKEYVASYIFFYPGFVDWIRIFLLILIYLL